MKRLALVAALASLAGAPAALAQSTPPDYTPPSATSPAPAPLGGVPPMPSLDTNQGAEVQRQLAPYRSQIDARVARGEITPEEAGRLLQWREWQIAQQVARRTPPAGGAYDAPPSAVYDAPPPGADAPPPQGSYDQATPPGPYAQAQPPVPYYYPQPYYAAPYYGPYYAPPYYYYGPGYYRPAPYYYGARDCAGGWGHHVAGRICI